MKSIVMVAPTDLFFNAISGEFRVYSDVGHSFVELMKLNVMVASLTFFLPFFFLYTTFSDLEFLIM